MSVGAVPRAFDRQGLPGRAGPFLAVFALAFLSGLLHTADRDGAAFLAAACVMAVVVASAVLVPWRRFPRMADATPALLTVLAIYLLRESTGGSFSGYTILAILPVVWLALYGCQGQTVLGIAALSAQFFVPLLLTDAPLEDLRRAAIWTAVAALVGLAINGLVRSQRRALDERRTMQDALSATEGRHNAIMASSEIVAFETDAAGRWTSLSSAFEPVLGIRAEDALGRLSHELSHPDDVPGNLAAYAGLADGSRSEVVHRHRYVHVDGSLRWVSVQLRARRGRMGEVAGFTGTMRDITERVQLEDERERDRAFLRAVLEQLADRVFVASPEGDLMPMNAGAREIRDTTGVTFEDWTTRHAICTPDGTRQLAVDELPLVRALRGETIDGFEAAIRRGDGFGHVVINARPIVDESGQSLGAVTSSIDVSALRQAEQRAEQHAADLETVGAIAHELAAQPDLDAVRQAIVAAAAKATGAGMAMLFEPDHDAKAMTCTAAAGPDAPAGAVLPPLPFASTSGTMRAFRSRKRVFVGRTRQAVGLNRAYVEDLQVNSAVWQPVIHEGRAVGVLMLGWRTEQERLPERSVRLLDLLAVDAALAIDRAALMAQLAESARIDALTGIANRRTWDEKLPDELARAARSGEPLAVAILDLDHFKAYNDNFGHQAGDRMLKETATAWRDQLRTADTVARYGGEEFALLLPACDEDAALEVVERLRAAVPHAQTASIGVALWDGLETADQLVSRADAALYRAKRAGRDQVVLARWERSFEGSATERLLRTARRLLGVDLTYVSEITAPGKFLMRGTDGDTQTFRISVGDVQDGIANYCQRVLDGELDNVVPDARANPVTRDLEVTERIAAYVGAPVFGSDGQPLGMLCGLSSRPMPELGDEDLRLLEDLARVVGEELERR